MGRHLPRIASGPGYLPPNLPESSAASRCFLKSCQRQNTGIIRLWFTQCVPLMRTLFEVINDVVVAAKHVPGAINN